MILNKLLSQKSMKILIEEEIKNEILDRFNYQTKLNQLKTIEKKMELIWD